MKHELKEATAEIERRDELLTHWDHCLSSFYGNNIIDSVRRAMRCVRDGVEIPKPWEQRPDYSNEMVKLKAEVERLTTEVSDFEEWKRKERVLRNIMSDNVDRLTEAADRIAELETENDNLRYANDFCGKRREELDAALRQIIKEDDGYYRTGAAIAREALKQGD